MAPLSSKQPFKVIYIALFATFTPPLIFLLAVKYLSKSLRPNPSLSYRAALVNAIVRIYFKFATNTRSQLLPPNRPGKAKERFALCQPGLKADYKGALASDLVTPAAVPGVWLPSAPSKGSESDKVILHFPGGAYVIAFELNFCAQKIADALLPGLGADKFFLAQYRLSRDESTRFPAALQDGVTFYKHVLSQGVKPENIILSGDSAGGNLALALLRYLESEETSLPTPGGIMCFSPWVDVHPEGEKVFKTWRNSQSDILTGGLVQWGTQSFRPKETNSKLEPYISPLSHPFSTSVKVFIQSGDADVFYDGVEMFSRQMSKVEGNQVVMDKTPMAGHDIVLMHDALGSTESFQRVLKKAKELLNP